MAAYLFLAAKRKKAEAAEMLALNTMAARGEPRALKSLQKDLAKD